MGAFRLVAAAGLLALSAGLHATEAEYSISSPIGLTDAEHTDPVDGSRYASGLAVSASGHVVGQSTQASIGAMFTGVSTWLFDGTTTTRISPADTEHTRWYVNTHTSQAYDMNASGQVVGTAVRWPELSADGSIGNTAWLFDGSNTFNIGFTDSVHTRSYDNYRNSGFEQNPLISTSSLDVMNDAGQVIGYSRRFDAAGASNGTTAWLYDGLNTVRIGYTDAEHTDETTGYQSSVALTINSAGQIVGRSARYDDDDTYLGNTVWRYDDGTMINIGLSDSEHTTGNGSSGNNVLQMNDAGDVLGYATRYEADNSYAGQTGWVYNGTETIAVSADKPLDMNSAGQVLSNEALYDDGVIVPIVGLSDPVHTSNSGSPSPLFNTS
ncbi:MAG: DUF3466 family protein, partial [Gammaproteobacteria bacterium]